MGWTTTMRARVTRLGIASDVTTLIGWLPRHYCMKSEREVIRGLIRWNRPPFRIALLIIALALALAIQWMRAIRLSSARWRLWRAIGNSVGAVVLLAAALANVGGLGEAFGSLLIVVSPSFQLVWAAAILIELVVFSVELSRLARARRRLERV